MLTNESLREYLLKTLEYPRVCNPLSRGSLLVQMARKQLKHADDETLRVAHENLIKLNNRLLTFYSDAEVKKEGLTLEELSQNLLEFLPSMDSILWYNGKNIGPAIDEFVNDMCERCGFDTI